MLPQDQKARLVVAAEESCELSEARAALADLEADLAQSRSEGAALAERCAAQEAWADESRAKLDAYDEVRGLLRDAPAVLAWQQELTVTASCHQCARQAPLAST